MNRKIAYIVSVLLMFVLVGVSNVYADEATSTVGEQHRSRVAKVVKELEKVANKDARIEDEVKDVAQEEKDVSEKVKEKMDKIEKRGAFRTFFFGSDYKNLGALRSDLVTTENSLERLNKALERTTNPATKVELENQIKDLESIQAKAEDFVKSMDGKFSLFGWLLRMF